MAMNDKALSRRRFLRLAAAGIGAAGAAGVLAACGGAAPGEAPAAEAPAEGNTVVVELDFWYWDGSGQIWADEYNKLNRGAKINFINTPFADTHDKLLTSFASGSGAPDITTLEIGRIGGFTAKGGLLDLKSAPYDGGKYEKDMVTYKWTQGSTADGRLVAMPWDIGPAGVWYRADIFAKLGLPTEPEAVEELISHTKGKTWQDFFALAQQVAEKSGGATKMVADAATDIYGGALRQGGEGYFDGMKVLIEEKATRPAQLAADFRKQGLDADIDWWGADWAAGVKNDAFAGMVIACWMQSGLSRDQPQVNGQWRVVPAPEASYNWGGSFCAIPEQTKNAELAWDFVQWACCTAEGQNAVFKPTGIFPAYKPAWQDPFYDEPVDFYGGQRAYRMWANIADNVASIVRSPYDLQTDDIVNAEMAKVMNEGKDPVQAMKDAEAEALKAIEGATP
jgi:multiple sugar transport system substrate-binding protein